MEINDMTLQEAAETYVSMGLCVFPCLPRSKHPATEHGFLDASDDLETVRKWWKENPKYNIGIATGLASGGLYVVDLDNKPDKDGLSSFDDWTMENGRVPDTWMACTGSGGRHLIFTEDSAHQNAAGVLPGVDIRADGGYIVAPPSIHPDTGQAYAWELGFSPEDLPPAELPPKLLQLGRGKHPGRKKKFRAPEAIEDHTRTDTLVSMIGQLSISGYSPEGIEALIRQENETKCSPPLTEEELQREVFPAIGRFEEHDAEKIAAKAVKLPAGLMERLRVLRPESYPFNDRGWGQLYADMYGGELRFNSTAKEWTHYDGKCWKQDTGGMIADRRAKELFDGLCAYVPEIAEEQKRTDFMKAAWKLGQLRARRTMIDDAKALNYITGESFDRDPFLLNLQNGVLDLRSFRFMEHSPDFLMTKICRAEYAPESNPAQWEKFVREVLQGDQGKIRYLQKALGYSLTGGSELECMMILYGSSTRNGKSTLVETFAYMLGNDAGYAMNMEPQTLAAKQNKDSRQASGDIARLKGCRFLVTSEPPRNMLFDASLVKSLTGHDTVTARHLHQSEIQFVPEFKMFMNTNYLPAINDETLFTSDRIVVIPFDRHFAPEEQDKNLKKKLMAQNNINGLLLWALDGLKAYYKEGLKLPAGIQSAVDEYHGTSDRIGKYLEECCEKDPEACESIKKAYLVYSAWCMECGFGSMSKTSFIEDITKKGLYKKTGTVNGKTVRGVLRGYRCDDEVAMEYRIL